MISQRQIDEIIEKNDIGEVIGEYVKLERKGSGYMGLCPFHNEKTPSFSVHEAKQIFKCFGCGLGGNVVNFIMHAEGMNYPEALEHLAKRAGIELEESVSKEQEDRKRLRNDIYAVNREAARFFYNELKKSRQAQKYFYDRGIRADTVKKFGLGYAPDSWDGLYRHFAGSAAAPDENLLVQAGLVTARSKGGGYIDKFRNRVMFPIFDVYGNVIAFGGRVMDDTKPKYINTNETPAYVKGNNLYGLNIAKKSQSKRVIMVEGYMDCIAIHKSGIPWAVASLGTALTQSQARLLKRYFSEVIIGYDADSAGQQATMRGLDILVQAGFRVRVLSLSEADPNVKDPDEFLRVQTADELIHLADIAKSLVEYKISKIAEEYPPSSLESKAMFLKNSVRVLASVSGSAERDMYEAWFAGKYNVSKSALSAEISEILQSGSLNSEKTAMLPVKKIKRAETGNNMQQEPVTPEQEKQDRLEKTLILLMSDDRKSFYRYYEHFRSIVGNDANRLLLDKLKERYENGSRTGLESVVADAACLPETNTEVLAGIIARWLVPPDIEKACADIMDKCVIINCDLRIACINSMLSDTTITEADRAALIKETATIIEERKKYKNGRK